MTDNQNSPFFVELAELYKEYPEAFLLLIFACTIGFNLIIPPVSAYTITGMNITPNENIIAGDSIYLSFTLTPTPVYYSDGRKYSADPDNTIAIVTALDNPVWTRRMVLNGASSVQVIKDTNLLMLEGWDIAYVQSSYETVGNDETIKIILTGYAPNVSSTSAVPFITISEHDKTGVKIKGSEQVFRQTVINKNDLASALYLAEQDLKQFEISIAEKQGMGIDVSAERSLYSSAVTILGITKQLPPDQYHDALTRLANINSLVYDGETALDRAWAAQEIDRASKPLSRLDNIIEWFADNSTMDYPGLQKIIAGQSNASQTLHLATEAMDHGQFEASRVFSDKAFQIANQSYNDGLIVQKRAKDPLTLFWDFEYPIIGIVVVVVGGWLLFKPRKKKPKKVITEKKE